MDFDTLQQRWSAYDERLDASLRLNRTLMREIALNKVNTALTRHARAVWFDLGTDILALLLLGSFLADHINDVRFFLPALLLHIFVISMLVGTIRELSAIYTDTADAPVIAIQARIEQVRVQHLRITKWILTLAPALWLPLLIVFSKGVLGIDVYQILDTTSFLANALFGLAWIPLALLLARLYTHNVERWPWLQRVAKHLTGEHLHAASDSLAALRRFEKEQAT